MKIYIDIIDGRFGNHLFKIGYYLSNQFTINTEILLNKYDKNIDNILTYNNIRHKFINNDSQKFKFNSYFQDYSLFDFSKLRKYYSCPIYVKKEIYEKIPNIENSIVIHVRRGDYLEAEDFYELSIEYYKNVIDKYNLENEQFVIISDDIEWCKQNFSFLKNIYFSENNLLFDFYCLTFSKFNICACSSFSMMGTYLNKNQNDHIVPIPYNKYNDTTITPPTYRRCCCTNKYFISFTSSNVSVNTPLDNCNNIAAYEAKTLNLFDDVYALTENDLDKDFYNLLQKYMKIYGSRGYGYWCWKPYIILKYLNQIKENDILVYMDSDFISLNENPELKIETLSNTFNKLFESNTGIIAHYGEGSTTRTYTTTKLLKCVEKYLDYQFTDAEIDDNHYAAGICFIRKCDKSMQIISLWNKIMQENFDLITDSHNNDNDNDKKFVENRHDQSVWSLLCKYFKIDIDNMSHGEFYDFYMNDYDWTKS